MNKHWKHSIIDKHIKGKIVKKITVDLQNLMFDAKHARSFVENHIKSEGDLMDLCNNIGRWADAHKDDPFEYCDKQLIAQDRLGAVLSQPTSPSPLIVLLFIYPARLNDKDLHDIASFIYKIEHQFIREYLASKIPELKSMVDQLHSHKLSKNYAVQDSPMQRNNAFRLFGGRPYFYKVLPDVGSRTLKNTVGSHSSDSHSHIKYNKL